MAAYKCLMMEPVGAAQATTIWKSLRPLEMKTLKHFWVLASPESPKLDLMEVVYSEWNDLLGY